MTLLPGEQEAIGQVIYLAELYGYGNLISRLKDAWSDKIQKRDGLPRHIADKSPGHICVWCGVDGRTGERAVSAGGEQ